ncbi:MAG TPA: hypothetical protein PKU97_24905, partial [Kofleriaceae bacterium]|nr:hypothetical protein [Kofleriaceae bacterium]
MARSSGSSANPAPELRMPCPFCGGLVHPIAGRCKHCKQDLAEHRARAGGVGGPGVAGGLGVAGGFGVAGGPGAGRA